VLLNIVPLGYELWRQFNGFPPVLSPSEPEGALFGPAAKDPTASEENDDAAAKDEGK
jgi:hypothetical protein